MKLETLGFMNTDQDLIYNWMPKYYILILLLFVIFINDISNIKTNGQFLLLTVDTSILFSSDNISDIEDYI